MMKKLAKGIMMITLVCSMVGSMMGCSSKSALTSSEFVSKMEEQKFTVVDCTEQYAEYDFVTDVQVALAEDGNYQIEFYQLSDETMAKNFFDHNSEVLENTYKARTLSTSMTTQHHQSYRFTSGGDYISICRIKDTFVYVVASSDYKDEIKTIIKELGY